jgi:LysR family glycine cleavage system transcriptional activator
MVRTKSDRQKLPPFAVLRAFEAVGRLGGIRRAAMELGVDHAVVSRHLRTLETWTGLALVDRTHGASHLTEDGARYHARISAALTEIARATSDLMQQRSGVRLTIWCVPGFATRWLSPRLDAFRAANEDLEIELRPTDFGPDFERNEADGDIRYVRDVSAQPVARGVRSLEFARPGVFPVAHPDAVAGWPEVRSPSDLLKLPLLHEENEDEWRAWLTAQGVDVPQRLPGPRLWHAHLTMAAAGRGQGVALANPFLIGDDIETGRLCRIDPPGARHAAVMLGGYAFLARDGQWDSKPMTKFRNWLRMNAEIA